MRVGIGFDIHRMVPGKKLVLGGVEIPHTHGLMTRSDGDVLLHAPRYYAADKSAG